MTFSEQMKHKAEEVHFTAKAKDFGDAAVEMARTALGALADLTTQNRDTIDGALAKAGQAFDEKTHGKHSEKVTTVRAQVDRGLDKLIEQGAKARHVVPEDRHSAFTEEASDASPASHPETPRG
ncbi:MAG: antitoxin [Intrasporangium sp.]|uniref:antitoxin n=1 Tax=Intrasporangium sp. TaxID=1925024 RepID=UPI002649E188|nr:antitoxin [Intrasporangium sp.]MDN5796129.1 antitoxin [Intrasporangium sp.]